MKPKDLPPGKYKWVDKGIFARGTTTGVRYGISFMNGSVRVREMVGDTIALARKVLRKRHTEIDEGRYELLSKPPAPPFPELSEQYLEHAKANKKSWRTDEHLIRKLSPSFGTKRLSEITSWNVEQHKARRRQEVSPATVNRELTLLRRMFNLAIEWGLATENPTRGVRKLREVQRPLRILTRDEQKRLLAAMPDYLRDITEFAIHTGMRRGEILGLRWDQVDGRTIAVERGKTGTVDYLPASRKVMKILQNRRKSTEKLHSVYVFTRAGKRIGEFYTAWRGAIRRSGIPPIRFHDLRHAFATRLLRLGEDIATVQELLGHSSVEMTRRYTHTNAERKRAAVEKL